MSSSTNLHAVGDTVQVARVMTQGGEATVTGIVQKITRNRIHVLCPLPGFDTVGRYSVRNETVIAHPSHVSAGA